MKIAIACDHGGYEYKRLLVPFMKGMGHEVTDMGCDGPESVDYPDFGIACAQAVVQGKAEKGILICGTGIGMSIAANKVRDIRCALCTDPLMARLSREHNNANMLAIGGRIIGIEMAKEIISVWLKTEFAGGRHQRRVDKISAYEGEN